MKDNNIQAIKALAIIGVVFHHIGNRRLDPNVREWTAWLSAIFDWCVLGFFAVSGWLHALSQEKKSGKSVIDFIRSRTSRLLVPFVVLVFAYSVIWQLIQKAHLLTLRGDIPTSLFGKLAASLWPSGTSSVAEQLYFLPLLFAVSITVHVAIALGRTRAVCFVAALAFILGLTVFPHSPNTGFSRGVLTWGFFSYAAGYLLYLNGNSRMGPLLLLLLLSVAIPAAGLVIVIKFVALILLLAAPSLRLGFWPLLPIIGEASGTIYAYHTPFLLQPMMIVVAKFKGDYLVFGLAMLASALSILICTLMFYKLRNTGFRRILM